MVTARLPHISATEKDTAGHGGGKDDEASGAASAVASVYFTGYSFERDEAWRSLVNGQKEYSKLMVNGHEDFGGGGGASLHTFLPSSCCCFDDFHTTGDP